MSFEARDNHSEGKTMEVETKVREVLSNVAGLPKDVDGRANLYLDLGVASVHALTLLSELESQFGVAVPDDEFVSATTVESLTALMTDLVAQEKGSSSHV
jgi:acyl carrier protein